MAVMQANPLQKLIDGVRQANDWSDEDIARRARERGHQLSKQTISDYRTKGIATVVPDRMRALADGLGLPAERVGIAALATIGLARFAGDPELAEDAVRADETLPEATRRAVLAIIADARKASDARAVLTTLPTRRGRHGRAESQRGEDEASVTYLEGTEDADGNRGEAAQPRTRAARKRRTPRAPEHSP